ncbi:MAG: 2-phospho-L-lactate transferase [Nitrososphaerota archaeon]
MTVLAGGVGGAKLVDGLAAIVGDEELRIIVNTADDEEFYGLHISPDIDTIVYTLAGIADKEKGWGIDGDTYRCLEMLSRYGLETWFKIGDMDFATHIFRTLMMQKGKKLSEITEIITKRLGIRQRVIPMTDGRVRTMVMTDEGYLSFQRYFVEKRGEVKVREVIYEGAEDTKPCPAVIPSILDSRAVIIAPSNPILSIGPILALQGVREALQRTKALRIGVTPIIAGRAVKGPVDRLMRDLGLEPNVVSVARLYSDILDLFIIDRADAELSGEVTKYVSKCLITDTLMQTRGDRIKLASYILTTIHQLRNSD